MWEEAYRVAKQNGGRTAANQVAFLWSRTLPIDSAIKLLNKYGILEPCINYACETYQFEFAFQLCKELPSKVTLCIIQNLDLMVETLGLGSSLQIRYGVGRRW